MSAGNVFPLAYAAEGIPECPEGLLLGVDGQ